MHRLLDMLKRILESPKRKKRPLVRRSEPVTTRTKLLLGLPKLTNEEIQYLTFFTDCCKRDFVTYHSKLADDFDLTFQRKYDYNVEATTFNDASSSRVQRLSEKEDEEERLRRENECIIIENVTESAHLFENSSRTYTRKDIVSV